MFVYLDEYELLARPRVAGHYIVNVTFINLDSELSLNEDHFLVHVLESTAAHV